MAEEGRSPRDPEIGVVVIKDMSSTVGVNECQAIPKELPSAPLRFTNKAAHQFFFDEVFKSVTGK